MKKMTRYEAEQKFHQIGEDVKYELESDIECDYFEGSDLYIRGLQSGEDLDDEIIEYFKGYYEN